MHELSAGSDHVRIEVESVGRLFVEADVVLPLGLDVGLAFLIVFGVTCGSEAPSSLLVHFGAWGNSIDGEINEFLGSDNFHDLVDVQVDVVEDLCFALGLRPVLWVSARMDNTVHIQVEVVDGRVVFLNLLSDHRLLFGSLIHARGLSQVVVEVNLVVVVKLLL